MNGPPTHNQAVDWAAFFTRSAVDTAVTLAKDLQLESSPGTRHVARPIPVLWPHHVFEVANECARLFTREAIDISQRARARHPNARAILELRGRKSEPSENNRTT